MNHRQLVAELRKLFEEEKKVQWRIGDLLCREVGPPRDDHTNDGTRDELMELAEDLGVALGTLLKYRRMAATYPEATRVASASFTAHEAASAAKDPAKVMAEAQRKAQANADRLTRNDKDGKTYKPQISVPLVREIASKPQHQNPINRPTTRTEMRQAPGGWGLELLSHIDGASRHLRRIVEMLRAMDPEEELSEKSHRMLLQALNRYEDYIGWTRTLMRGDDITNEAAEFLSNH